MTLGRQALLFIIQPNVASWWNWVQRQDNC